MNESSSEVIKNSNQIERYFGTSFSIRTVNDGDVIPIGENILDGSSYNLIADFSNLRSFFDETNNALRKKISDSESLKQLQEWLSSQNIDIDPRIFMSCYVFTRKFLEKYPDFYKNIIERGQKRKKILDSEKNVKLSTLFKEDAFECAEISALAKRFLQENDINCVYFNGDMLSSDQDEFSENHSFLIILHNGEIYLFDPANPTNTTQGFFPSIYELKTGDKDSFFQEIRSRKVFFPFEDVLTRKVIYYGVNNGTNVSKEKDLAS